MKTDVEKAYGFVIWRTLFPEQCIIIQVTRIGYVIGEAMCKGKMQGPFIKHNYEFPGGDSIALEQMTAHLYT